MKTQLDFLQNVNSGTIKPDVQNKRTNKTASEIFSGKYTSSVHIHIDLF